jgi:hypothetical protein
MFNPYFARPIGSERFEKHLLTLMVRGAEEAKEAAELIHEMPYSLQVEEHDPVRWDPLDEGWKLLGLAVYAMAINDYLFEYEQRLRSEDEGNLVYAEVHESRCLTLENEFFRVCEDRECMIDSLLREICHNREDRYMRERIDRIHETQKRISRWIWFEQCHEQKSFGGRVKA